MSEEIKNSENLGSEQPTKKPFSVTIPEDDFVNDIPAPETDVPADAKPRKVVRYVDNAPKKEPETKKKKGGFVGEFLAGAAAGAKTVAEVRERTRATAFCGSCTQRVEDFLNLLLSGEAVAKKEEPKPATPPAPPAPSAEEKLLTEIRDLLKNK